MRRVAFFMTFYWQLVCRGVASPPFERFGRLIAQREVGVGSLICILSLIRSYRVCFGRRRPWSFLAALTRQRRYVLAYLKWSHGRF